jgi:S-adenosylmethionine uptake transporter
MASGMFLFSAVDAMCKVLTETLHPVQILWFRQLGLLGGVLIYLSFKGLSVLRTNRLGLQILRGFSSIVSACSFIFALRYLPLAEAVAVSFVAPFFVVLMAASVLKEKVGLRRWLSILVGFIGALIIIRPGLGVFDPATILVLIAAFAFAGRQVLSRFLSGLDNLSTTIAYTALTCSCAVTLVLPFVWSLPASGREWLLLFCVAIVAGLGELCIIMALNVAQAVVVAPVQYTLIIWGTFYGYLIFGNLPDFLTLLGAIVISLSGLYALRHETREALIQVR